MNDQTKEIDALPTKELFISMLTKDLTLKDAIGDLVDNSLDGARRIRKDDRYEGLWIKIEITEELFRIADNCGGISADLARDYAFRFGRPPGMEVVRRSVGQFGIGMKRALFKLGKNFSIESTSASSHFVVEIDVDSWKEKEEWKFEFTEINTESQPEEGRGTTITVTSLLDDVIERFKLEVFTTELTEELRFEHLSNISKGLDIRVNGKSLDAPQLLLIQSDDFQTAYDKKVYPDGMEVEIFAGISKRSLDDGGWYIFCNERLILGPDQGWVTGWGATEAGRIPKYHSQFDRFRGYVFFSADNASLLPLNTTKTSMDLDSPRFRAIRLKMIQLMRPVINFLNELHTEHVRYTRNETAKQPLKEALECSEADALLNLPEIPRAGAGFNYPQLPPTTQPRIGRIRYSKPMDEIDEVKRVLGVQTLKEVGERTFEYFVEMEVNQ